MQCMRLIVVNLHVNVKCCGASAIRILRNIQWETLVQVYL